MTYQSVTAVRPGLSDVLQITTHNLHTPAKHEVGIRVLASAVCRPDITARRGEALYSGLPWGNNPPFVPGYVIIGEVDALGEDVHNIAIGDRVGALTVLGGYTEYLFWESDRVFPVPKAVDLAQAVTLILNYLVAYQTMHRSAQVKENATVLIVGASGGIGTALMQLGQLHHLKMYGIASKSKHHILADYGVTPIDYRTEDFVDILNHAEPDGIDAVFDGMMQLHYINGGLSLLKQGGIVVSFGEPPSRMELVKIIFKTLITNLLPNGKSIKLYGTSKYFFGDQQPFLDDWATLFQLLQEGKIKPVIAAKFPLLEAAKANELLESGDVVGNIVLLAPEFLE